MFTSISNAYRKRGSMCICIMPMKDEGTDTTLTSVQRYEDEASGQFT